MATVITQVRQFTTNEEVTATKLNDIASSATLSTIADTDMAQITTASKVHGTSLTGLASVVSGAGKLPVANIDTGTTANKIVILDGTAKLPAVDGSQLTNVSVGGDDMITRGFEIGNAVADNTTLTINPGILFHSTTKVSKTAATTLTFATAADWWDGATDSYAGGAGWCYVGVKSDGSIKLLGANPPDKADTAGNAVGTLYYWYDTTNYWRVIGAVMIDTDNQVHAIGHVQTGNIVMHDVPVSITTSTSAGTWSGATACSGAIPAISTCGIFGIKVTHDAAASSVLIRPNGTTWATDYENGVSVADASGGVSYGATGQRVCLTDTSQQIQFYTVNATNVAIDCEGYILNIR